MARLRNKCSIFFRLQAQKVKIPVNPQAIEIQYPTDHKTYDVLGMGEIVVPRKPSLKMVSWESFFPTDRNKSYVNSGAKNPAFYVRCFERALREKQILRLIISRSGSFDTNMRCIVSDFKIKDKGGEPGDIYYSLKLQEYKSYSPSTLTIITPPVQPEQNWGSGVVVTSAEVTDVVAETQRPVETPVLRVGAGVIVHGVYCNDSYGSKPHGMANNISTEIKRIVTGNPYPVLVGNYGWVQESQLQLAQSAPDFRPY